MTHFYHLFVVLSTVILLSSAFIPMGAKLHQSILGMASSPQKNGENDDWVEESPGRRQILFSLLAASGSSTTIPFFLSPRPSDAAVPIMEGLNSDQGDIVDISNKPPLDDRDYVTYVLDNGLRIILCSDPLTGEAGVAMDVHVGACSDPEGVRGLAHFNEHMLFLGTKDYPREDSFQEFLSSNGGSSNAYTSSEDTVYYFTLQTEGGGDSGEILRGGRTTRLMEGLKRFGSFFVSPLFTETATGRELNAIESEHSKNLQSDAFRTYQLQKGRQNQAHPHSKFFTGNKRTLLEDTRRAGIDLRGELIKFHDQFYSADQMTLAVVAPQSIDELKEMAKAAFSSIPNRTKGRPEDAWKFVIPPFINNGNTNSLIPTTGVIVNVLPVQDLRQVTITWPILYSNDSDRTDALLIKQAVYVAQLIRHQGPGSLLSFMKRKGWANVISAGNEAELSDYETFEVTVGLTATGLANVNDVVGSIFSYIRLLRDKKIPNRFYNEALLLAELKWRYASRVEVGGYVQSLATSLQKYPPALCIAGPRRLALCGDDSNPITVAPRISFSSERQLEFTRSLTTKIVSSLNVDNAMITVASKTFRGTTNRKEEWYGTEYRVDPIPETVMTGWKRCADPKTLGMDFPRPNAFLPTESGLRLKFDSPLSLKRLRKQTFEERISPPSPPRIIRDDGPDGRWTVYYKPDEQFGQPKAFVIFQLLSKRVFSLSATNAALSNLYEFCVSDKLGEYAYDAALAGLTYDVKIVPRGIRLTFGGYSDKLQTFATYVSNKISADIKDILPRDEIEFERYKDIVSRALAAFDTKQPYAHCSFYSQLTMKPLAFQYSNREMREATERITNNDLVSYVNQIWSSGKGLALVQGNLNEKESLALLSTIDNTLRFETISVKEFPAELKPLPLPPVPSNTMPTRLVISEPNPNNSNSASYFAIQNLSENPKEHVMMELLASIIAEPFFEELRTKQQLGYIVTSGLRGIGKTKFLDFMVQSSVATTDKLTIEISKYLDSVLPILLEKIKKGDFAIYVKSLIERKTEPDKELETQVTRNWAEIGSGRLEFDRTQREIAVLLELTRDDLLDFWSKLYLNDDRRVIITEMVPRVGPVSIAAPPTSMKGLSSKVGITNSLILGIDDIEQFRKDREIF